MKLACYFSIAMTVILSGCAGNPTIGAQFNSSMVHKIKTGTSTKENVLSLMGAPFGKNTSSNGTSVWTYDFTDRKSPIGAMIGLGGDSKLSQQTLMVTFNKSDVVATCIYKTLSIKGSGMAGASMLLAYTGNREDETMNCENVRE